MITDINEQSARELADDILAPLVKVGAVDASSVPLIARLIVLHFEIKHRRELAAQRERKQ